MAFFKIPDKGLQLLFGSHQNLHQNVVMGQVVIFFNFYIPENPHKCYLIISDSISLSPSQKYIGVLVHG